MPNKSDCRRRAAGRRVLAGVSLLFATHGSAAADSLDFKATPLSDAIARIDQAFNVTLDLKGGINPRRTVTFSVANIQDDGALLETVNSLANAINADYRKQFVIIQITDGSKPIDPVIDAADAPVVFDSETQSAAKAIAVVAGVDDASSVIPPHLLGSVTFTGKNLTAREAARQIAQQTHSEWKTAFVLTPHTDRSSPAGKVIGYTPGGRPIIEMQTITFRKTKPAAADSSGQTPETLRDPVYMSAFMRRDKSAMLKFRPKLPDGSADTGHQNAP